MREFTTIAQLEAAQAEDLPPGPWTIIDQERIDLFARATDDFQWIHVDRERAASGPYGGTIAHGFLSLSLLPALAARSFRLNMPGRHVNYGLNRVRFPAPVRAGARVRVRSRVEDVSAHPHGMLLTMSHVLEIDGTDRPGCVAEVLTLFPEAER